MALIPSDFILERLNRFEEKASALGLAPGKALHEVLAEQGILGEIEWDEEDAELDAALVLWDVLEPLYATDRRRDALPIDDLRRLVWGQIGLALRYDAPLDGTKWFTEWAVRIEEGDIRRELPGDQIPIEFLSAWDAFQADQEYEFGTSVTWVLDEQGMRIGGVETKRLAQEFVHRGAWVVTWSTGFIGSSVLMVDTVNDIPDPAFQQAVPWETAEQFLDANGWLPTEQSFIEEALVEHGVENFDDLTVGGFAREKGEV